MQAEEEFMGKWIDEPCTEKKNLVVGQKLQSWSNERVQKILFELRDALGDANVKMAELKHDLVEANRKINEKQTLVPIGFIYPQLPNEKAPAEIWPSMNWTDVSSTYAGLFFRVSGGDAAAFGQVQPENVPRLTVYSGDFDHIKNSNLTFNDETSISQTGWSDSIRTEPHIDLGCSGCTYMNMKFSTGEIRPQNMAFRVWKRTG